jgi:ribosomal protein L12E/L44/L45/RPP1/RPP2
MTALTLSLRVGPSAVGDAGVSPVHTKGTSDDDEDDEDDEDEEDDDEEESDWE